MVYPNYAGCSRKQNVYAFFHVSYDYKHTARPAVKWKISHLGQIRSLLGDVALFGQIDKLDLYKYDLQDLDHISLMGSVRSRSYTHVCLRGICMI